MASKKDYWSLTRVLIEDTVSYVHRKCRSCEDLYDRHLVLSGSGMRLYSFVGAMYALHCLGYRFTKVTGTSGGALIAAKMASMYDPDSSREDRAESLRSLMSAALSYEVSDLLDPQWFVWRIATSLSGIIRGRKISQLLRRELPKRFDQLLMPCEVTAFQVNLVDPMTRIISEGDLPSAVRASMSIPGVFTPVRRNGMLLVDGGIQMNLPLPEGGDGVVALTFGTGSDGRMVDVKNNLQMMLKLADGAVDEGVRRAIEHAPNATVIPLKSKIKSLDFFASSEEKIQAVDLGASSVVDWNESMVGDS